MSSVPLFSRREQRERLDRRGARRRLDRFADLTLRGSVRDAGSLGGPGSSKESQAGEAGRSARVARPGAPAARFDPR